MTKAFLLIAALLAGTAALLHCAPRLRILNFVDYDAPDSVARINRYAAKRLLLPIAVSLGCAYVAETRLELGVPLLFLVILSILAAVVWIAAGRASMDKR